MATTALAEIIPGWSVASDANTERLDTDLLARAYHFSDRAHAGQRRRNGDPFVTHCVEVAKILADLQLDSVTVASGLIHDVVEDTNVTLEDVEREFGREVAQIVDGLTKIGHLPMTSREERQVENYRKLLLSIAKDIRVILIKLADRLHNMRTLDYLDEPKRIRIAQETLDIYAPLAHRLGIEDVKWQLEDLAFAALYPKRYAEIETLVLQRDSERETYLDEVIATVRARLEELGIRAEITGRPKRYWSIYEKKIGRAHV